MSIDVLTVSSKGQVVLPAGMRKALSIGNGDKLAAYSSGKVIILKPIKMPTEGDFIAMLDEAQEWAEEADYKESDVNDIIKASRKRKRL